jgi:hypothetical protein
MDQSDNVDTEYLLINNHILAQATPANAGNNTKATVLSNGSDNALVDMFLDPTLGCTPWTVASPTAPKGVSPGLSLNELVANTFQQNPALVPENDPMVVVAGNNGNPTPNLQKINLYRAGVGQTPAASLANAAAVPYCQQIAASGIFIAGNQALFANALSPAPAVANNLFTFMAQRFAASFAAVPALGCVTFFGLNTSPVNLTLNGNCVVVAATINTVVLQNILNGNTKPVVTNFPPPVAATTSTAATTAKASSAASAKSSAAATTSAAASKKPGGAGSSAANNAGSSQAAATTSAATSAAAAQTTAAAPSGGKNGGGPGGPGGNGGAPGPFPRVRPRFWVKPGRRGIFMS